MQDHTNIMILDGFGWSLAVLADLHQSEDNRFCLGVSVSSWLIKVHFLHLFKKRIIMGVPHKSLVFWN